MIRSMTGYGRNELINIHRKITVEIKSVNHRYSDVNIKLPRSYIFLEEFIRENVLKSISRGKIDVFLTVDNYNCENQAVKVDIFLLEEYSKALRLISEQSGVLNDASASILARFPDVLTVEKLEEDKEQLALEVGEALGGAIKEFIATREREGGRIGVFLNERAEYILSVVDKIEEIMPRTVEDYRTKLTAKTKELLGEISVDENRILTEVAIFADRICTDEEIVRLKSHISELKEMLSQDQPIGRRLDFLIQEMNREINTIGSKANELSISKLVVEVKSEIEKLREQVQNIE